MRILAVDDERYQLERLVEVIGEACPEAEVIAFRRPTSLLEYLQGEGKYQEFDLAFMDNNMGGMTGLQLARQVKELRPDLGIMFVSGLQEFQLSPGDMNTAGFIMKPVTASRVKQEIESYLQQGLPLCPRPGREAGIRCFGEFDVVNGDRRSVSFKEPRIKLIFAAIVMAGDQGVTPRKLTELISQPDKYSMIREIQLRLMLGDLKKDLSNHGIPDIFWQKDGRIGIRADLVDCDYYRFLEMDPAAVMAWRGEFMTQYPWAEFSL